MPCWRELPGASPARSATASRRHRVLAAPGGSAGGTRQKPLSESRKVMSDSDEFTLLDDSALLSRRAEIRAELERLQPASPGYAVLTALYDKSTEEVNNRARKAWT